MPPDQIATLNTLGRLAVALAIGLMIGLERGWEQRERRGRPQVRRAVPIASLAMLAAGALGLVPVIRGG